MRRLALDQTGANTALWQEKEEEKEKFEVARFIV